MNLFMSSLIQSNDGAIANFRKLVKDMFDVFRLNIEAFGSNDQVLFAAAVVETPFPVHCSQIARVKPAAAFGGDTFSANQDLSIWRNLHFHSRQRFAERTTLGIKRMIDCHNWTCFG